MTPDAEALKALKRGLYYTRLYVPVEDGPDAAKDLNKKERDIRLIEAVIDRLSREGPRT